MVLNKRNKNMNNLMILIVTYKVIFLFYYIVSIKQTTFSQSCTLTRDDLLEHSVYS